MINDSYLRAPLCDYNNNFIKLSLKEEEDFVILSDESWKFLADIYGTNPTSDIPRYSIETEKEDEDDMS